MDCPQQPLTVLPVLGWHMHKRQLFNSARCLGKTADARKTAWGIHSVEGFGTCITACETTFFPSFLQGFVHMCTLHHQLLTYQDLLQQRL